MLSKKKTDKKKCKLVDNIPTKPLSSGQGEKEAWMAKEHNETMEGDGNVECLW
jgi:hypothetical protein